MPLAYAFWHQPGPDVAADGYERDLTLFHQRLAVVPIAGFITSRTLRVPDLPWLPGGGYEDWYVIDDFAALGALATAAVDDERSQTHDALAGAVAGEHAAGGLYALVAGDSSAPPGWCGWFTKQDGVRYPELLTNLQDQVDGGRALAVWQRQLVLGPGLEFRVEAADPVPVRGAELAVGVRTSVSG